jgi:hypothetical protein
MYASALEKSRT